MSRPSVVRCAVIDGGFLEEWKTAKAPDIAVRYWKMAENATIRDVILVVRADEDHHREVSTHLAHCIATFQLLPCAGVSC